jgi:uncharacterized OB-fold protein
LTAVRYADGSLGYPAHTLGSDGNPPVDTIDLREYTAEIITWTKATATPPGVREPNTLAIVEFEIDDESVRAIGQVTTTEITIGDRVEPVYVSELRDPTAGIREPDSQAWDGYRFKPIK